VRRRIVSPGAWVHAQQDVTGTWQVLYIIEQGGASMPTSDVTFQASIGRSSIRPDSRDGSTSR